MTESPKSRTRPSRDTLIDTSVYIVMVAVAIFIFIGMLLMMLLTSCGDNDREDKRKQTQEIAVESLRLVTGNPHSLNVIAFSEMDSVFGNNYFSNDEMQQILQNTMSFSDRMFGENSMDVDFSDPRNEAKFMRMSSLSELAKNMMYGLAESAEEPEFSGWKLKALYEYVDKYNDTIKNERYFIFDKEQKYILHSFDIPIL